MSPQSASSLPEDDPLVDRLRDTLRIEAEAVSPFTGRTRSIAAIHDWRARRRAARRRRVGAALAVAAVAVIGVSAAVVANRPAHSTAVGVGGGATAPQTWHAGRTTFGPQATKAAPPTAPGVVPASFSPLSATFVTIDIGYTLGTVSCGSGRCLAVAATLDGGSTWTDLGVPSASGGPLTLPPSGPVDLSLRFSDQDNGWIYGHVGSQPVLWWTGDAGHTWKSVGQSITAGGYVAALEAVDHRAEAAVVRATTGGITMISSPQSSTVWQPASRQLPLGAGKPGASLVLQRQAGWFVENAPTFVAGARLDSSGRWTSWVPYCSRGYAVHVAAVDPSHVFAVCQAASGSAPAQLYYSTDGGTSWSSIGTAPAGLQVQQIAASSVDTITLSGVSDGRSVIAQSIDHGTTFTPVWEAPGSVTELGFEDTTQGIAMVSAHGRAQMLMTIDGGLSWRPVHFQVPPPSGSL